MSRYCKWNGNATMPRMGQTLCKTTMPRMGHTILARGFNPENHNNATSRPAGPHESAHRASTISGDPSGRNSLGDVVSGLKPRAKDVIPSGEFFDMPRMGHTPRNTTMPRIGQTFRNGNMPRMGQTYLARGFNPETPNTPYTRPEGPHEHNHPYPQLSEIIP